MSKVVDHPLIKDKLTRMRNEETVSTVFRSNLEELTNLLVYEATKGMEVTSKPIKTPICETVGYKLANKICLVPILRAGLGMVDPIKNLIPTASIGHIGLYRDEKTLEAVEYYSKMPPHISECDVLLLDPMLATGHSCAKAIEMIKKYNPKSITFIAILGSPEGIEYLEKAHSDVEIYLAAIDEKLNDNGYIVPGLGDAGDRLFGTK
ncbi:MAG: uracil phosphoribosyltransferase [Mycoplasma sp.]